MDTGVTYEPVEPELLEATGPDEVLGFFCKKQHFNDPSVPYCSTCGISMAQRTRTLVPGVRPPLGVLVLDDGTMFPLLRDHVLGRTPEADPTVASGQSVPVMLLDPLVSRVHARIVLDGWDVCVLDAGSANGTFICGPDETTWTRVPRGAKAALPPGGVLALGQRQIRYHSYRRI